MKLLGFDVGDCRLPLTGLAEKERRKLLSAMLSTGLLR